MVLTSDQLVNHCQQNHHPTVPQKEPFRTNITIKTQLGLHFPPEPRSVVTVTSDRCGDVDPPQMLPEPLILPLEILHMELRLMWTCS